jgi:hypothetical protein
VLNFMIYERSLLDCFRIFRCTFGEEIIGDDFTTNRTVSCIMEFFVEKGEGLRGRIGFSEGIGAESDSDSDSANSQARVKRWIRTE